MTTQALAERTPASGTCVQPREELAQLLALSAHGDTEAFAAFYDRTCATTHHLALALCGDQDRAADLVQTLYVSAWVRARHQAGSGLSPLAWLLAGAARSARSAVGAHGARG